MPANDLAIRLPRVAGAVSRFEWTGKSAGVSWLARRRIALRS
jgi:hypothetical protein